MKPKQELLEAIQNLLDSSSRSKIGLIRELYGEIERLKKLGVRQKDIVETLREKGIQIDITVLRMILSRIRKERQADPDVPLVYQHSKEVGNNQHRMEEKISPVETTNDENPIERADSLKNIMRSEMDVSKYMK